MVMLKTSFNSSTTRYLGSFLCATDTRFCKRWAEQTEEYNTLTNIAGEMFNDLKKLNAKKESVNKTRKTDVLRVRKHRNKAEIKQK